MAKVGRPSKYTGKLAEEICKRLANGESLRAICREKAMPNRDNVRKWLTKHEEFHGQYARAREDQADALADEVLDVGRDDEIDANRARVCIDALKWAAGKLRPKVYGDRQQLDVSGDIQVTSINLSGVPAVDKEAGGD